jgi:hypothetical protein
MPWPHVWMCCMGRLARHVRSKHRFIRGCGLGLSGQPSNCHAEGSPSIPAYPASICQGPAGGLQHAVGVQVPKLGVNAALQLDHTATKTLGATVLPAIEMTVRNGGCVPAERSTLSPPGSCRNASQRRPDTSVANLPATQNYMAVMMERNGSMRSKRGPIF